MKVQKSFGEVFQKIIELGGKASVRDLEKYFEHARIMRAVLFFEKEGILKKKEEIRQEYVLSNEGLDYLKRGLPERRLINALKQGKKNVEEIKIEDLGIALANCAKRGLIKVQREGGITFVELSDSGKNFLKEKLPEEIILEDVYAKKTPGKDLDELIKRNLIKTKKIREINLEITKDVKIEIEEKEVSSLTPEVIKNWKNYRFREYDVKAPVKVIYPGKKHFYRAFLDEVRKKLLMLGFVERKSPIVELEFWNFDVLFQAQNHVAREIHDKFELSYPEFGRIENIDLARKVAKMHQYGFEDSIGWGYKWSIKKALKLMLRSQNTAMSARVLAQNLKAPAKVFTIDRVFRPDAIDRTHLMEFYQMEGIVLDKNLNFRHLLGYLKIFGEKIAEAEKIKFVPAYFPFTEPSVELHCFRKDFGWLEVGGAGIFRPEVLLPLGIKERVLAWGMGIDRLAMFKFGIEDIRELVFPKDINLLRKGVVM